jgi:polysaccharide biosynthesis transport protein
MSLQRVQNLPAPQRRSGDGAPNPASGPLGSGNHEPPIFRLNLLRALELHRRMALGFALGGLFLAVAYSIRAWPVYLAQSQIYVQPVQSKVMSAGVDSALMTNAAAYDSFVQQQVQSATNPDVLMSALHKLPAGRWQRKGEREQAAAARLGGVIQVSRVGTSYEVAIAAKAKDPQLVADIANAVATSVVERASGEGNAGNAQRITVLQDERTRIQDALNADYAEQNDLNKQLGMAAVGTQAPDLIDADIGKTREELIKAQTQHDEAESRFAAMGAGKGSSSTAIDAEADELVAADAGLTSMKTSLNARRATLITQMANLTPNNPEYKQDAEELAKINSNLDAMMSDLRGKASARIQQRLRTDLERTAGVESRLNGQLRQLASTAASATPKLQRASDLATDINRLRLRYSNVDEQLHNLMLDGSTPGAVHMSVVAVPPVHPAISGILKKAIPCIFGGVLLGLLAAAIANHLDPKVYIAADIVQTLGFAPMAVLPDFDEVSEEVSAEHLLRLSAAIEHARKQDSLDNCIFTGTSSGVGVTTVVSRVNDMLKAMGRPTVLLDSSGTPPPTPRAASSKDQSATEPGTRSTALLRQVADQSRMEEENLVLMDTAPLLISAETEYLARFVDCAIVVVESGVTTREQLLAAAATLQRLDVAVVGFVLNRAKLAIADRAFRNSVHEIEKHHRAQSMSSARRPERTSPLAEGPSSVAKELARESTVVSRGTSHDETRNSEPSTPARAQAAPAWSTAPPVKPWLPQTQNIAGTKNDSELPWWLSDAQGKPPAQTGIPHEPKPHDVSAHEIERHEPTTHEPGPRLPGNLDLHPRLIPVQAWENASGWAVDFKPAHAINNAPVAAEEPVTPLEEKAALPAVEAVAPVHLPELVPVAAEAIATKAAEAVDPVVVPHPAAVEPAPIAALESAPAALAVPPATPVHNEDINAGQVPSRLNPLRGVMFSLGLKNLNRARTGAAEQAETPAPVIANKKSDRAVIERALSQFAEPVPVTAPLAVVATPGEPVREVTTEPEFLPPKEFVPMLEKQEAEGNSSASGVSREESFDAPRTLPSRRGQYKRRG